MLLWEIHLHICNFLFRSDIPICSAAATKLLQSCPTLFDPLEGNPPGSTVTGILQATTLEWGAISFSNAWKWSHSATPWTAAYQAPPFMGFSRQGYWSGLPLPSPPVCFTKLQFPVSLSLSVSRFPSDIFSIILLFFMGLIIKTWDGAFWKLFLRTQ